MGNCGFDPCKWSYFTLLTTGRAGRGPSCTLLYLENFPTHIFWHPATTSRRCDAGIASSKQVDMTAGTKRPDDKFNPLAMIRF